MTMTFRSTRRRPARLTLLLSACFATMMACGDDATRDTSGDSVASDSASRTGAAVTMTPDSLARDTGWVASPRGIGPVRAGMPRGSLLAHIGQPSRAGYYAQERCTYLGGTALPAGVQVMIFDSTVARIDVAQPGVRTREGAQVGDAEAAVLAMYRGHVAVTPHAYSGPQWHYLTVTPPGDTLHRIVFETDGATVKSYRVGRLPEVDWVEGCS